MCCSNFPCRVVGWLIAFFIWYQIFAAVHIGLVSQLGLIAHPLILILWNAIFILTISSLFAAAFTEPTSIDPKFKVPEEFLSETSTGTSERSTSFYKKLGEYATEHPELSFQIVDLDEFSFPKFCEHCKVFKPPRTHHCRSCRKCIPRMDHHCPVIGTCVHFHNHKFFLLFLFWAFMLCFTATVIISPSIYDIFVVSGMPQFGPLVEVIPAMIATSGLTNAMVCGLALAFFQLYLWWMLQRNETTLESHEDEEDRPNYDLGSSLANIKSIFGKNILFWCLPFPTTEGDGFSFVEKNCSNTDQDE